MLLAKSKRPKLTFLFIRIEIDFQIKSGAGFRGHEERTLNQGCGSGSGSVLDPYSIGSVDPDPDP